MALAVTHTKVSAKADGADSSLVLPSDWNAAHTLTGVASLAQGGTGRSDGANLVKAWVNFNGTGAVSVRASFNVSSITDNGTGDFTINFSSALADANYAVAGMVGHTSSGGYAKIKDNTTPTTSAVSIATLLNLGNALQDHTYTTAMIIGN